jgi:calcium-dependent protein kinase
MQEVTHQLKEFCKFNSFQKMILSLLSSLKIQKDKDEPKKLRMVFNRIDKNHDGHLTVDELKSGLSDLQLILQADQFSDDNIYDEILKNVDLNGDRKIDYEEFVQASINHRSLLT